MAKVTCRQCGGCITLEPPDWFYGMLFGLIAGWFYFA